MFGSMRRRTRWKRWLKRGCTTVLLVLAAPFFISLARPIRYRVATSDGALGVVVESGWLAMGYQAQPQIPPWFRVQYGPDIMDSIDKLERVGWGRYLRHPGQQTAPAWLLAVPLWIPILVVVLPTGILWYRDRPFPRGHCRRCGHDLTNVRAERCPECGLDIPSLGRGARPA
jgi:hypothetical protein